MLKSAGFEKAFIFFLLIFYPFMISAENTEKCRFFVPQFFFFEAPKNKRVISMHIKMLE